MDVLEAIRNRRSSRRYKPDPVPRKVLEEILETCRWAPSSSNTQPWQFAILGGKVIETVKARLSEKVEAEWDRDLLKFKELHPDIPYSNLRDPYRQRSVETRNKIDSWQFPPGTPDLDKKRKQYLLQGGRFYDAPNAIILYTEKYLLPKAILDIGLMAQSIALAAHSRGLGTCLMAMPLNWPELIREMLDIPDDKAMGLVVAIGYPDTQAKVNTTERVRESLGNIAHWHGF
ncbi:MAG: nitroreductase [Dehalococcoidales bacterium]|nr:nitroreductase [Dehalococcoidales bacterium]